MVLKRAGHCQSQNWGMKDQVRVGCQKPFSACCLCCQAQGMDFAIPPWRQFVVVNHLEPAGCLGSLGPLIGNASGSIGGIIVDQDEFIVGAILLE
jgi:hypothetical protein